MELLFVVIHTGSSLSCLLAFYTIPIFTILNSKSLYTQDKPFNVHAQLHQRAHFLFVWFICRACHARQTPEQSERRSLQKATSLFLRRPRRERNTPFPTPYLISGTICTPNLVSYTGTFSDCYATGTMSEQREIPCWGFGNVKVHAWLNSCFRCDCRLASDRQKFAFQCDEHTLADEAMLAYKHSSAFAMPTSKAGHFPQQIPLTGRCFLQLLCQNCTGKGACLATTSLCRVSSLGLDVGAAKGPSQDFGRKIARAKKNQEYVTPILLEYLLKQKCYFIFSPCSKVVVINLIHIWFNKTKLTVNRMKLCFTSICL